MVRAVRETGMYETAPWLKFYADVPHSLDYPELTLYQAVMGTAERLPHATAYDFLGLRRSYQQMGREIDRCASALAALGLTKGDRIVISMPTSPQGVIAFYAANKLGAVPAMIHPLSPAKEIQFYVECSRSRFAITLDAFYGKFVEAMQETELETLILARLPDYLTTFKRLGYWATKGRKIGRVPPDPSVRRWSELMSAAPSESKMADVSPDDLAAILFSGGTTGSPKGIMLSNRNLISEGMQVAAWAGMRQGDSILAILPIFHGFGLGVCINAAFMGGGKSIMVPTFSPKSVARLIKKERPNLLVGVPTLYDALTRERSFGRADLRCLRAAFSGADTLPRPVKDRFESLVRKRGGTVRLLEGYGLTEAVTAIMATPMNMYREGSIGVPFPDTYAKICVPGTDREVPVGDEGEICVSGPAVMMGYLDQPEETAKVLRPHGDGRLWLHTGDLGKMDEDGFFYFTCRLKRMIKSSGFNVYPSQVEKVLYRHPAVKDACVIGVPDERQVERVKAIVVLKDAAMETDSTKKSLIDHCQEHLIQWSCPREVEFRSELPRTQVGKVDYRTLAAQESRSPGDAG